MTAARSNSFLRRRTVLAAALAAVGMGAASSALADPGLVDLKVVDRETGRPLQVWRRHGRLYVAGEPGSRYALRVTNHSSGRVLVVMSVDGVNILTGQTAGYDQRGYVFEPYQSYDLTGWRKSDTEVAAFVFSPLPDSYAARTGRPADVGVIGIAAFREKVVPVVAPQVSSIEHRGGYRDERRYAPEPAPPPPPPFNGAARAAPAAPADRLADVTGSRLQAPEEKLGTGHGAREWSVTHTVAFERATSYPQLVQQIEYDTFDNLVAQGVIPAWADQRRHPRPFPTHPDGEGYVPDPPQEP